MIANAVVIDTNVLVAALLTADASSPPAQILNGMLGGLFPYMLSPTLLAEYRAMLLRPAICSRHGLDEEEVDHLLEEIVGGAIWREPVPEIPAPDPGDNHLWALAASHPGTCLVTGDRLLLDNPHPDIIVLSPRQFLTTLT